MSHGAGPQILTAERYQFFQTVGSEGAGADNWHSHKEESGVGGGGGAECCSIWVNTKSGAIAACGESSDHLHQIGSFSPSTGGSLSKWKIMERETRGFSSCRREESGGPFAGLWLPH